MHQNNVTPCTAFIPGYQPPYNIWPGVPQIKVRYIRVLVICQSFPVTCMIRNAVIYKISLYSLCGKKMQLAVGFTTIKNMRRETYKCFIYFRGLNSTVTMSIKTPAWQVDIRSWVFCSIHGVLFTPSHTSH